MKIYMLLYVSYVYDVFIIVLVRVCIKFLWENNILSVIGRFNVGKIGIILLKFIVLENKVIFVYKICL